MTHAIIGCGRVSGNHVYAARENHIHVSSCFDIDIAKAEVLASEQEIPQVATSLDEIWNDRAIASVSICTDHASHSPLTIAALKSGKHVLVEKPMAIDLPDAITMFEVARDSGRTLAVVSQHRYNPLVQEIRELVRSGFMGRPGIGIATLECHKTVSYYRDSSWRGVRSCEGGSTIINQFIHTLDILIWTFGLPVRVNGCAGNMGFGDLIETEDTFCGWLEFANGFMVSIASTNCSSTHWDSRITFVASEGTIVFSTGHPVRIQTFESSNPDASITLERLHRIGKSTEARTPPSMSYYGTSHVEQFKDFVDAWNLERPLLMHPTEALRTLSVVRALYRSAELRRSVEIRDQSIIPTLIEGSN